MSSAPTLIFLHIPKTGGTTLNHILQNHFSPGRIYATSANPLHPAGSPEDLATLPDQQKVTYDLLIGHMGFGLHQQLPRLATYATILRHPIERLLSNYYHEARDPRSQHHTAIQSGQMDWQTYLNHHHEAGQDNLQTRMLSGNWSYHGSGDCTPAMLDQAKTNLANHFSVVGISEQFDETYLLLCQQFGWQPNTYRRQNVTHRRPQQYSLRPGDRQLIIDSNQYDLALYQYVQTQFKQRIQQLGVSFRLKTTSYRLRNRLHNLHWQLRQYSLRTALKKRFTAS